MDNVSNIDLCSCQLSKVKLNNNPIKSLNKLIKKMGFVKESLNIFITLIIRYFQWTLQGEIITIL
jgi:hypothetical protein